MMTSYCQICDAGGVEFTPATEMYRCRECGHISPIAYSTSIKAAKRSKEDHARTRLGTPASDLLNACKAARRAFADLNGQVSRETWNNLYEVTRTLDAAIAKANEIA